MIPPYPIVTAKKPFFYVTVDGVDLTTIKTTGATQLQVYRVWKNSNNPTSSPSSTSLNSPPDYVSPYNIPPYYTGSDVGTNTPINPINYTPLEQKKNKFTFVFDSQLFTQGGGRYQADFYYLGTLVASLFFIYQADVPEITGMTNV